MLDALVVVNLLPEFSDGVRYSHNYSLILVREKHSAFHLRLSGCAYLSVVAMALANKKTGQMAITTIIAKATSSDT
jgi:hypothetical protein